MGMASTLTLVSNPGSASRKYGLYHGPVLRANLHFEWSGDKIVCTLTQNQKHTDIPVDIHTLNAAAGHAATIFYEHGAMEASEHIGKIGLRVVAPGTYFMEHRLVDQRYVDRLQAARPQAPLHITATLDELKALHHQFPQAKIVGVSDSAFHASKPDYAKLYAIPIHDAEKLDIKRFGYHGLSAEAVVRYLQKMGKLVPRLIVAHLGSGASITAVYHGKSVDTTMGYSPLEGLTMATRSGTIDFTAVRAIKSGLGLDDAQVEDYLNHQSGLLGLGGSNSILELLEQEAKGSDKAKLAMQTYIFNVQKAIGQMAGALGGVDMLVFTGTVGERNPVIRQRVADKLHYLDVQLSAKSNNGCTKPLEPVPINKRVASKPVLVIPANENAIIASHATN